MDNRQAVEQALSPPRAGPGAFTLGGFDFGPTKYAVPGQPNDVDRFLGGLTRLPFAIAEGIGNLVLQGHRAAPWGGNDPTAIGIYPDRMAPEHYPRYTAGGIDPSVMVPFAADTAGLATTGSLAAPAVRNATGMGIRAYHGSPHDFDRFSMDKIGTGEGAQAYGHGLYFAENEAVARSYKEALANRKTMPGNTPSPLKTAWSVVSGSAERAAMATDDLLPYVKKAWPDVPDAEIRAAIDEAKAAWSPGRMYEVDINASPDEFLDWDKPLSEQPEKVREAVKASYGDIRPVRLKDGSYSVTRVRPDGSGDTIWDVKAATADEALAQFDDWLAAASGRDVYEQVARGLDITPGSEQGAATGNFRAAGIKGIRYKDAGSRVPDWQILSPAETTSGKWRVHQMGNNGRNFDTEADARAFLEQNAPTSNYVVFDDNIIEILRKYGIAGLTAGGAGAAVLGGSTQDAPAASTSYMTLGRF